MSATQRAVPRPPFCSYRPTPAALPRSASRPVPSFATLAANGALMTFKSLLPASAKTPPPGANVCAPPFKYKPWLKSTGPKQPTEESGGANGRYSQTCKYSIRQNRALMADVRSLVGVAADITEQICGEN